MQTRKRKGNHKVLDMHGPILREGKREKRCTVCERGEGGSEVHETFVISDDVEVRRTP